MTFPANYAVMAEDELTYVTGGGVIANVLPAVMTSENWRTFSVNVVKIIGNSFMTSMVNTILGTAFGTPEVYFTPFDDLVFAPENSGRGFLSSDKGFFNVMLAAVPVTRKFSVLILA